MGFFKNKTDVKFRSTIFNERSCFQITILFIHYKIICSHYANFMLIVSLACIDKSDWCNDIFPAYCYDPAVQSTCCSTCSKVETGKQGKSKVNVGLIFVFLLCDLHWHHQNCICVPLLCITIWNSLSYILRHVLLDIIIIHTGL